MKFYTLTNKATCDLQLSTRGLFGKPGLIYNLRKGNSLEITEDQMSGDIKLKINKKLLSVVEAERETVKSSFISSTVESETAQKTPLSTRGRKKKTF